MKFSELSSKDVIREEDGVRLGKISDVTIDVASGKVLSVSINNGIKLLSFISNREVTQIPWNKIIKIGSDVIIVETVHINKEIENKT